ncbi:2-oxoisovalerate dehydrogenase E2 component (dihydrolipoyl transacylase) [Conyzicola nivalis]|uniref:Dihydrolipoamide acetyltransferase component of pyruvate dehydrogenase complex n=1 Tax=Conyzicola nivalis TaxID=1477021 RepID=A0ABV2QLA7_9MICO
MSVREFAMPDLGEGLTESELVSWEVAEGDTVELNQVIAEVETAKALVQLPSPWAGTVSRLLVQPGVVVRVGSPIVAIEVADAAGYSASEPPARNAVLVGYGPPVEGGSRPQRKTRGALLEREAPAATGAEPAAPATLAAAGPAPVAPVPVEPDAATRPAERPLSTPPVRKLAADLGVRLELVRGTGERGMITRDDVLRAGASAEASARPSPGPHAPAPAAHTAPDETRIPISGVRRRTAEAMVASAFTAPQATVFLTVDVTPTVELLEVVRARAREGARPGILAVVAKALCIAVTRTPEINARWDESAAEIVQWRTVNLGIAAATDRGLIVPVVPAANELTLDRLANALAALSESARAGTTTPAALRGGTITISNVGVFGVDAGTPILVPGEAAILALGAISRRPWEHDGEIALRSVLTLSLSFDHRVVDGQQAATFLADIGAILAEPGVVLSMV